MQRTRILYNWKKNFSAINVHASKHAYNSNVCLVRPITVSDVCPSKTISVRNTPSSNSVSAFYVHPAKSCGASNIC